MQKGHLCCSLSGASVRVFVQSPAVVWGPFPGQCIVLFSHCCVTVIVLKHMLLSIIKHWFPTLSLSLSLLLSCSPSLFHCHVYLSLPLWLLLFSFFTPFLMFLCWQQTKERVKLLIQLADGFCDKGHAHALEIKKWVSSVDKRYRDFSLRMDKYRTCLETALGISSDSNKSVSAPIGVKAEY